MLDIVRCYVIMGFLVNIYSGWGKRFPCLILLHETQLFSGGKKDSFLAGVIN